MFVSMRAKKPAGIKLQYCCQYEDKKTKKNKKNKQPKNKVKQYNQNRPQGLRIDHRIV
jgi:hypothetical protein